MNHFRRCCAIILLIPLVLSCLSLRGFAAEQDVSFCLTVEGTIAPGHTLTFGTDPVLEGVIYAIRSDPEEPLTMLEGNTYTIPSDAADGSALFVTAWWEEFVPRSDLELIIRAEFPEPTAPPEETTPAETEPVETQPEETAPAETEPAETQPEETTPEETIPKETQPEETEPDTEPLGPGLYFGQLHGHTSLSGGTGSIREAFAFAAGVPGLDFFALTDHSHTFDGGEDAQLSQDAISVSECWAEGKAAAAEVTGREFVGIFGFEMSWQAQNKLGHIATFHTPGFVSRDIPPFDHQSTALNHYYAALAEQDGSVSQFNHPGEPYGNFADFAYSETGDAAISLMELGSGNGITTDAYLRALDKGWHLAPTNNHPHYQGQWGSAGSGRTVVYAQSLTEEGLCEAMGQRRVYATEDSDLEILYSLSGYFMGSVVSRRQIGDAAQISVSLSDPTDSAVGTVEVITTGSTILACETVSESWAQLNISLPGDHPYYLLRITQPDGDIAVTAPVWVRQQETLGIRNLHCETDVPVQNQHITLALELYNQESAPLCIDTIQIRTRDQILAADDSLSLLPAGGNLTHRITISPDLIGSETIAVVVQGTLEGLPREYTAQIPLSFRRSQEAQDILLTGSCDHLQIFQKEAGGTGLRLTDTVTPEALEACRLLLVTAPEEGFPPDFLDAVREFMEYGGSVAVFGSGESAENEKLNTLLDAIGATARLGASLPADTPPLDFRINREASFCAGIAPDQKYRMDTGCSLDPGQSQWLVKTGDSIESLALLTWEKTGAGGQILVSGSLFITDSCMAEPEDIWMPPYANRALGLALLDIASDPLPITPVRQVREAEPGQLLKIRGYVTAGTDNPYTRFPDTLYLEDETGGIAVIPFAEPGIPVGTPMEITGYPELSGRNFVLNPVSYRILNSAAHIYPAQKGNWTELTDYERNGSLLISVEGTCTQVSLASDGTLQGFSLKNAAGDPVQIQIDSTIFSGATGKNTLHKKVLKGRTIRALGLLHIREDGTAVVRVRNCDEVVYVPPLDEIPKTGDRIGYPVWAMAACLTILWRRCRRRS